MQIVRLLNFSPSGSPGACGLSGPLLVCRREPDMKKCFDITRLLCLSVLLSVFCFSSVLAAPAGEAPALRVALLLEDAAPDRGCSRPGRSWASARPSWWPRPRAATA